LTLIAVIWLTNKPHTAFLSQDGVISHRQQKAFWGHFRAFQNASIFAESGGEDDY
jgi:hypothetical protein